jgi:hypothetical protein
MYKRIGDRDSCPRRKKAAVGASPHHFRPTYAGANVGHPSLTFDIVRNKKVENTLCFLSERAATFDSLSRIRPRVLNFMKNFGCPISRSFFARCGIPRISVSNPLVQVKTEGKGRVPHVRTSVRGPKMMGQSPYGRFFLKTA